MYVCVCGERERQLIYLLVTHNVPFNRGESVTIQTGKVTASTWMDRKTVMVMSTNCQPSSCGTVNGKQRDGTSLEVACPESIISYNKFMGEVDRGDHLSGYYRCRSESRKFYKINTYFSFSLMWQSPTLTSCSSLLALAPTRTSSHSDSSSQRNWSGTTVVQRSWWDRHPPPSIPALSHQAGQWWAKTSTGQLCPSPWCPPSPCLHHVVLSWVWGVAVPYRRHKWLFHKMAHTTACLTY